MSTTHYEIRFHTEASLSTGLHGILPADHPFCVDPSMELNAGGVVAYEHAGRRRFVNLSHIVWVEMTALEYPDPESPPEPSPFS